MYLESWSTLLSLRRIAYGLFAFVMVLSISSCGYRFTADGGSRLTAGQKVWVAYFKNSTVFPNASVVLKRAIFDQFAAMRGITPAGSKGDGDIQVEGILTGYGASAASYTSTDTVKEYRLVISANVIVRKKSADLKAKPIWSGSVSAWQDYPVSSTIEMQRNSEDAALAAASRKLAEQIIWNMEQVY